MIFREFPLQKRGLRAELQGFDAPSTGSCSFDNGDGCPDCGVYIQMRGIEQVRIRGANEGRGRARAVAFVTLKNVGEDFRFINALAAFF